MIWFLYVKGFKKPPALKFVIPIKSKTGITLEITIMTITVAVADDRSALAAFEVVTRISPNCYRRSLALMILGIEKSPPHICVESRPRTAAKEK
jgi:hypothetical protein